jgi:hypothetical protein
MASDRLAVRKAIEWSVALELVTLAREHLDRLTSGERAHLIALLRKSRGRPGNLTAQERRDIRRLTAKLELLELGRRAAPVARRLRPVRE